MSARKMKPPGRRYRVVKSFPWIEGGRPAPGPQWWEGGEDVVYEPGDIVYMEDQDAARKYHTLEAIDDAGRANLEAARANLEAARANLEAARANLEAARAKPKAPARRTAVADFDAEQHNSITWGLFRSRVRQGEELKTALIWAIRSGARLPDDYESRNWIADVLEGKHAPKKGKGRPRKQPLRPNLIQTIVEDGTVKAYHNWLEAFRSDRELAWLRFETMRLWQEKPDAALWCRANDLGTEEGRQSFKTALTDLGARPCPSEARGAETPRDLALRATAQERRAAWEAVTGKSLTPSVVARLVTRAKKSE